MKLFISYSRDDKHFVYELAEKLRNNIVQHDVWIDRRLVGAQRWWDTILDSIEECQSFVAILTPRSVTSIYCEAELAYALAVSKPILPLLLKQCDIPQSLREIQYTDISSLSLSDALLSCVIALNRVEIDLRDGKYPPLAVKPPRPPAPKVSAPQHANEVFAAAEEAAAKNDIALAESLYQQVISADAQGLGVRAHVRMAEIHTPSKDRANASDEKENDNDVEARSNPPTLDHVSEPLTKPSNLVLTSANKYYTGIMTLQDTIPYASKLFDKGSVVQDDQYDRIINFLHRISRSVHDLLDTIERLPIDIKPWRFPLVRALNKVDTLVSELEPLIAEHRASLHLEIQHKFDLLLQSFHEVKDSFDVLDNKYPGEVQLISTDTGDLQPGRQSSAPVQDFTLSPAKLLSLEEARKERNTSELLDLDKVSPVELLKAMLSTYNLEEFESLCWELQLIYDNLESELEGETLRGRMQSLIGYFRRRGNYEELVRKVLKDRPHLANKLRKQ